MASSDSLSAISPPAAIQAGDWDTIPASCRYVARTYSETSSSTTSVFSECNSVRSGSSSYTVSTDAYTQTSDETVKLIVINLNSSCLSTQRKAAVELHGITKDSDENRLRVVKSGVLSPLISILSSSDAQIEELGVTTICNLSLCLENQAPIVDAGAIPKLIDSIRSGTPTARSNAACTLLRLARSNQHYSLSISRAGAIPALVSLLEDGTERGKKDAATALFELLGVAENRSLAIEAGIVRVLIELMTELESVMVDKALFVFRRAAALPEGRAAAVEDGGIPVLVEMIENGKDQQKEIAAIILLDICRDKDDYRRLVAGESPVPALLNFLHSGVSIRNKKKVEYLVKLLRQPRMTPNQ